MNGVEDVDDSLFALFLAPSKANDEAAIETTSLAARERALQSAMNVFAPLSAHLRTGLQLLFFLATLHTKVASPRRRLFVVLTHVSILPFRPMPQGSAGLSQPLNFEF